MKNPFNITYGMIPSSLIGRSEAYEKIKNAFLSEDAIASTYIITGIRGSGKTVLLRSVAKEIKTRSGWIVINLNPQGDLISSFAESLYEEVKKNKLEFAWSIDLSFPYIIFKLAKKNEPMSAEKAIPHLLEALRKKGKRILLLIDEVNQTKSFKIFANLYQSLIGEDYPLFLLMTGLYENVDALISDKASSFLSRSPKIVLNPLDLISISRMYQKELKASIEEANELAKLTKGYAFAYQVIGNLCFERQKAIIDEELLNQIDDYLFENGYNVIWKGMTGGEKKISLALAKSTSEKTAEISKKVGMKESNFNNFRSRMIYKGYLVSDGYGKLSFALPRFKEFVLRAASLME